MSLSLSIRKFIVFRERESRCKRVISWDDSEEMTHVEKMEKKQIGWDDVITMGYARYSLKERKWQIADRYVLSETSGESEEIDIISDHLKKCFPARPGKHLIPEQKNRD